MKLSPSIEALIEGLRHLPGVGPKSAQRMTLHLLERDREGAQQIAEAIEVALSKVCLLYTSPSPRDQRGSRMPSSA